VTTCPTFDTVVREAVLVRLMAAGATACAATSAGSAEVAVGEGASTASAEIRPDVVLLDVALGVAVGVADGSDGSSDGVADEVSDDDVLAVGDGSAAVGEGLSVAVRTDGDAGAFAAAVVFEVGVGDGVAVGSAYAIIGADSSPNVSAAAARPTRGRGNARDMTTPGDGGYTTRRTGSTESSASARYQPFTTST